MIVQVIDGGRAHEGRDWPVELRHHLAYVRQRAAAYLAQHPEEAQACMAELGAALGDPDSQVRRLSARALAAVGEAAIDILIVALGHQRPVAREWAAALLGLLGPAARAAEAALRITASFDPAYEVRWAALQALEQALPKEQASEPSGRESSADQA